MRQLIAWLFGGSRASKSASGAEAVVRPAPAAPSVAAPAGRLAAPPSLHQSEAALPPLNDSQIEFLQGLVDPPPVLTLDDHSKGDRLFLGGIVKRLHQRAFELLVLPEVAIRLSEMIRKGDHPVPAYVALLNRDTSLSVEVLKVANSAYYGAATPTRSLHDAVIRIGLNRLESLLMLAHLNARILSRRDVQEKALLLLSVGFPIGYLANQTASLRGEAPDGCFTRGMLLHVEHLAILGAVAEMEREQRCVVKPSTRGILQAFVTHGPEIRSILAKAWNLPDLLLCGEEAAALRDQYGALRDAVICRWLGRDGPAVPGVSAEMLSALLESIPCRVPPAADTAGEPAQKSA